MGSVRQAWINLAVGAVVVGSALAFSPDVRADPVDAPTPPGQQDPDTGIGCLGTCPAWKFPDDTDCVPPASFSQPMCFCSSIIPDPAGQTAPC